MNSTAPSPNERCQYSNGCLNSLLNYCSHCQLLLCTEHLNEHYRQSKTSTLSDAEQHEYLLEELMKKLNEQKLLVDRFYQRENENLIQFYSFVKSFSEQNSASTSKELSFVDHQKQIDELNDLKTTKIPFIQSWMFQIDQILENKSTIRVEDFELDSSEDSDVIAISDDEMLIETTFDGESQLSSSYSDPSFSVASESVDQASSLVEHRCPLRLSNVFGLKYGNKIPHVPCNFTNDGGPLIRAGWSHHLMTHHNLKEKVAHQISKEYLAKKNQNKDLTKIEILSDLPLDSILSQSTAKFIGLCPFRNESVYGLKAPDDYALCQNQTTIYLQQHFCHTHRFSSSVARRLVKAVIEQEPFSREIFSKSAC